MARALKVFRTAAGFHDAYVAAPSRKAALDAWGADVDLFARGIAEQVTDPALTAEPLKKPGEVIKRSRGGLADQLKAMGPRKSQPAPKPGKASSAPAPRRAKPPSRARLDKAEAALTEAARRQAHEMGKLEQERARLEAKITALAARHQREIAKLKQRRKEAEADYRDALDAWGG
ncbi:MAG: hypothetical protein ACEQR8_05455 [Cypionkella sp.]